MCCYFQLPGPPATAPLAIIPGQRRVESSPQSNTRFSRPRQQEVSASSVDLSSSLEEVLTVDNLQETALFFDKKLEKIVIFLESTRYSQQYHCSYLFEYKRKRTSTCYNKNWTDSWSFWNWNSTWVSLLSKIHKFNHKMLIFFNRKAESKEINKFLHPI